MKNDKNPEFTRFRWAFTSSKKKDKLLADTKNILRLLPETKALLDLAERNNIDIRFNGDFIGTDDSGVTVTDRNRGTVHIEVKPYRTPEDSVIALIHELRHVWQNHQLGLTPKTMALGEPDARTALLLTRVKEADAYAYTDIAISRLNAAMEAINAGGTEDEIADATVAQLVKQLPQDRKNAAKKFIEALTWLDGYDRAALAAYHHRYTDPVFPPLRHLDNVDGHVVTLADIRKLAKTDDGVLAISYLDHLDDKAFTEAIMKDIRPPLLEAVHSMEAFEKAAKLKESPRFPKSTP